MDGHTLVLADGAHPQGIATDFEDTPQCENPAQQAEGLLMEDQIPDYFSQETDCLQETDCITESQTLADSAVLEQEDDIPREESQTRIRLDRHLRSTIKPPLYYM